MNKDSVPYLLKLVQQNPIIKALLASDDMKNVEFKNVEYTVITDSAIEFKDFLLGEHDSFEIATFSIMRDIDLEKPGCTQKLFILNTRNSKYFDNATFFFNDDEDSLYNKHPLIQKKRHATKSFGFIKIFDSEPPAIVSISKNPIYGYCIYLSFYSDYNDRIERFKFVSEALINDYYGPFDVESNKSI